MCLLVADLICASKENENLPYVLTFNTSEPDEHCFLCDGYESCGIALCKLTRSPNLPLWRHVETGSKL